MAYLRGVDAVPTSFLAIGHRETFLPYAYQAYEIFVRAEKILFTTGDGSILQRLSSLYNRSKHIASAINDNRIAPGSTLAVWLNNEGLRAVDGRLTFDEMAEILEELARWSDA
jgi:hypothetical protein